MKYWLPVWVGVIFPLISEWIKSSKLEVLEYDILGKLSLCCLPLIQDSQKGLVSLIHFKLIPSTKLLFTNSCNRGKLTWPSLLS